jgi:FkbM family methyltransferase
MTMPLSGKLRASRLELEAHSRKHAAGVYYGEHRLLCRLLGDFLAFVDTRDLMLAPHLALDGFWEAWVTLAIARYLRPGMWCVDVGACYGYYTLLMVRGCGPEGHVVACEPNPLLARMYLPQNLMLNGFCHEVEICSKVISNVDGQMVDFALCNDDGNIGASSLEYLARGDHCRETIQVPAITLDQLCADWPRLDLVKIDAEGAESLVWEGMQQTLRRFPHAVVVLELHLQHNPLRAASLLHQIEHAGYPLRGIDYDGDLALVSPDEILARPQEHWALWLQRAG